MHERARGQAGLFGSLFYSQAHIDFPFTFPLEKYLALSGFNLII
jgi:hypothetical protein